MKYKSKAKFIEDVDKEWDQLWTMIDSIPSKKLLIRKKLGGELAWSVKDAIAHVYEWHMMLLSWHRADQKGKQPEMPAKGYNWRMTRELNGVIHAKHRDVEWQSIKRRIKLSHKRVMKIVTDSEEREFMEPGQYNWTRKLSLCSFVSANTASHYRWAQKTIRSLKLGK